MVSAVELSCDILETLYQEDGAGVTELATRLDRSKSTIHNHLATLKRNDMVVKRNDEYYLTFRFVEFGQYVQNQIECIEVLQHNVDELAETTGEISHLMIEENGTGVLLHTARGENAVQTGAHPGIRTPLHCTGLGKAILANLPRDRVERIIERHGLPSQTPNTITDEDVLFDELDRIADRGLAFDEQESYLGLGCVAAAIEDPSKGIVGAISVSGPVSRMGEQRLETEIKPLVRDAANIIQVNIIRPGGHDIKKAVE